MSEAIGKKRLLKATRRLMLKKGFNATSLDEICQEAHITKGALFYHFKDKEALGKAAVEYHIAIGQQLMSNAPFLKKRDPLAKLISYIDFITKSTTDPIEEGCLLGMFSQELGTTKNDTLLACRQGFIDWQTALEEMIKEAHIKHNPELKLNYSSLAQQFLATYEGAIIIAKATKNCGAIKNAMNHYKNYLQLLFSGPAKV